VNNLREQPCCFRDGMANVVTPAHCYQGTFGGDWVAMVFRLPEMNDLSVHQCCTPLRLALLLNQWHRENVSAAGTQCASDLTKRGLWIKDVLKHILCDVKINTLILERQGLQVFTAKPVDCRSKGRSRIKLAANIMWAFTRKPDTRSAIDRRGFVNNRRLPAWKKPLNCPHQCSLSRNRVAMGTQVVIAKPWI